MEVVFFFKSVRQRFVLSFFKLSQTRPNNALGKMLSIMQMCQISVVEFVVASFDFVLH